MIQCSKYSLVGESGDYVAVAYVEVRILSGLMTGLKIVMLRMKCQSLIVYPAFNYLVSKY